MRYWLLAIAFLASAALADIAIQNEYGGTEPISTTVSSGSDLAIVCTVTSSKDTGNSTTPTGITFNTSENFSIAVETSDYTGGQDAAWSSIWYLQNPTVTTANVDVTWSEAQDQHYTHCYVVTDFFQTGSPVENTDTDAVNGTACNSGRTLSLTDSDGGFVVAGHVCDNGASHNFTWGSATEAFDTVIASGSAHTGADELVTGTSARSVTVSSNLSNTGDQAAVGVVFKQEVASQSVVPLITGQKMRRNQ